MKRDLANVVAIVAGVILLAAGGPWLVTQVRSLPSHGQLAARSGQRIVTLDVNGMTCPACAARLHDALASTAGVSQCDVRLAQKQVYVVCDAATPDTTLTAAVHRAGPGYRAWVATNN